MSRKIVLFGNGSSGNHGCEAIYRGTRELLECPLLIQTENEAEDSKYGIGQFADLSPSKSSDVSLIGKLDFIFAKAKLSKEMDATSPKINIEKKEIL